MDSKVAIGIPVYNGERWLAETVKSVLHQSFSDFRIVISDNASTDRSPEIAQELAKSDSRILYHSNAQNVGVFRNFDITFELCESRYFKWCSVGDCLHPSFLESAVDILDSQTDVVLVYARTRLIGSLANTPDIQDVDLALSSSDLISRYTEYFMRARLNSPFHGLMRRETLLKTSLNKPFLGSDECLIVALLLQGKFVSLPDEMLFRRIEKSTSTATKLPEELDEFYSAEAKKVTFLPTWKFQKQLIHDVLRAPLKNQQKVSLLRFLLHRLVWQRTKLMKELVSLVMPGSRSS